MVKIRPIYATFILFLQFQIYKKIINGFISYYESLTHSCSWSRFWSWSQIKPKNCTQINSLGKQTISTLGCKQNSCANKQTFPSLQLVQPASCPKPNIGEGGSRYKASGHKSPVHTWHATWTELLTSTPVTSTPVTSSLI